MTFWENRYLEWERDRKEYPTDRDVPERHRQWELEAIERTLDFAVADAKPLQSVLDYGCGFGRFFPFFQRRGYLYTGAEIIPGVVAEAKRRHPDGTFLLVSQLNPGLVPDIVFMAMVLQHITDAEAVQAMKIAEKAVVIDNSRPDGPDYVTYRDEEEIIGLFREAEKEDVSSATLETKHNQYRLYCGNG